MQYTDTTERCMSFDKQVFESLYQDIIQADCQQNPTQESLLEKINQQHQFYECDECLSPQQLESNQIDSKDLMFMNSVSTIASPMASPQSSRNKRKNHQLNFSGQDDQDTPSITRRKLTRGPRPRNGHKRGYPTKNFLATFKGPHIEWLLKHLGAQYVDRLEIIQRINSKFGISMKDYEDLYNMKELRPIWAKMFECKFLFRALMVSRCVTEVRKVYVPKLPVFEKAFEEHRFYKIN